MSALVNSSKAIDGIEEMNLSGKYSKNGATLKSEEVLTAPTTTDNSVKVVVPEAPSPKAAASTGGKIDNPNVSSGTDEKIVSQKSLTDIVEDGKEIGRKATFIMKVFLGLEEDADDTYCLKWGKETLRDGIAGRSSPVVGNTWNAVIAKTRVAASQSALFDLLFDDNRITEYDDMFDTYKHLVEVDDRTKIKRVCCKAIWPTTARDFIACTTWQRLDDGSIIICTRSASDDLFEKQKSFVRATINISGYWIQPVAALPTDDPMYESSSIEGDNVCKVTLISHMDLGGSLPAYVLNMVQVEAPIKTLSGIRKAVQNKSTEKLSAAAAAPQKS